MPTPQGSGVARSILKNILGLSANTTDRVMQIIKDSQDNQNVKTSQMRTRIGARAMQYVRNAIEQSSAQKTKKPTDKKSLKPTEKDETGEKEGLDESMSFMVSLLEIGAHQAARMSSPSQEDRRKAAMQTDNEYRQDMEKEISDMEQSEDPDKKTYARKQKELAMLKQRLADKERQEQQASGMQTAGGPGI